MFCIKQKTISVLEKYFTGNTFTYRQIIAIILPLLIDQAFVSGFGMINAAMISSSGVAAISAVNMVDSLNVFLLNIFIAIATGGTVVVAQYKGVENHEMVSKAASQSITLIAILSVFVSVLIIVFRLPTLNLLFGKAEEAVYQNASLYLLGSCISYPFFAITEAVCGALRGVAQTRAAMALSLVKNILWVLLNVLFVLILDMGVMGIVYSMNISRVTSMICAFVYLVKYNESIRFKLKSLLQFSFSIQKKILFIGIPFAMEQMFFNGGKILTQTFIVSLGTYSMTVNAIGSSLLMLIQIGANALSLSVVTVVGQCMGRRDIEDARKYIKSFLGAASVLILLNLAVIFPLMPLLVRMFQPPGEIVPVIYQVVLMAGIAEPILWPISFITPSALRAAGDSKYTSVASLLSMWLFQVVLGYILGIILHFGIAGVWAAMIFEWGVRGVIFMLRFRGNKWCCHRLID